MRKKLKICHVITRMIVGGAQENTLLTVLGLLEKGHETVLVTGPSPGPEGELLKKKDLPQFEIVENEHLLREINPYHDLMAYFSLKKFFKERKFDVVHTHSSKAGIIGRAAAYAAGVPFVTHTVHGQAFHPYEKAWKNFIYKAAERWAATKCHMIYSVCQAMIDQCVTEKIAPAEKYKVVYSGMDLEPFLTSSPDSELRKKLGIPENRKVVGTVARLFPLKGYEFILPMAEKILKSFPETHFLLVGDGIMRKGMEEEIEKLGMKDHFTFAGLVRPDEIYKYTALMDILVHLSLREGLPRAVVQALASGKPAIGFKLDGTPEVIIDGKTGFTADAENLEQVISALEKLLADSGLCTDMGKNGRELVSVNFDWRRMASILEEEYFKHLGVK